MTRIEIAKQIKKQYQKLSKVIAAATIEEIAKGLDILPGEEAGFTEAYFKHSMYTITADEWKAIKKAIADDYVKAVNNSKDEIRDDEGHLLLTAWTWSDIAYITYRIDDSGKVHISYRGADHCTAKNRRWTEDSKVLEVKQSNRTSILAKRWQKVEEAFGWNRDSALFLKKAC